MNIRYINILIIVFLCCLFTERSNSQTQTSENNKSKDYIGNYLENLYVQTDRDIYISGEQVRLKIYKLSGLTGRPDNMSKVVYIELLDGQYNPVNQFKVLLDEPSGSTVFTLSDTLSSGNYLICAYTRWMLNFPGNREVYKPIYIINPFKKIDYAFPDSESQPSDNDVKLQSSGNKPLPNPYIKKVKNQINIKITPLMNTYKARERVNLDISVTDISGNPVNADMSVSVIKSPLFFNEGMNNYSGYFSDTILNTFKKSRESLPELEGEFITGTIRYNTTGESLKNADISLSFAGKSSRCLFSKTDDNGRFVFVEKDQVGNGEMVIQPLSREIRDIYIDLDQSFSTVSDEYFFLFPEIDSSRMEGINKAIISMQVNKIYEQFRKKLVMPVEDIKNSDFYGEPVRRKKMSDFIELTDIREVVKEILPEVQVFRRNKEIGLKVMNDDPFESFKNMALVLVDGVPVHNIEALLSISAGEFERIDIINIRYFYREFIFEGIVSFVTKKGNLRIPGSDNSEFRQVYEGFQKNEDFYLPDYSSDSLRTSTIPDFRNTIYWNPNIKSGREGKSQVQFFTSDEFGEYTIVIEGITSDGRCGINRIPLKIK